jgi:APA family basic amino acid/polyamine antiporter
MAIFTYRKREPNAHRPFRTPGYPVTPVLFIASALAIVINTLVTQPVRGFIGLGGVALGIPIYYVWRSRGTVAPPTETTAREGAGR